MDKIKTLISLFQMETQSNKCTDFIVWLDAREQLINDQEKKVKEIKSKNKKGLKTKMFG